MCSSDLASASSTAQALPAARATSIWTRSSSSLRHLQLPLPPPSFILAPTPVPLASCTQTSPQPSALPCPLTPIFARGRPRCSPPDPADPCFRSSSLFCPAGRAPVPSEPSRRQLVYSLGRLAARHCVAGAPCNPSWGSLRARQDTCPREARCVVAGSVGGSEGVPSEYVRTCPTCHRVKADHLPPA